MLEMMTMNEIKICGKETSMLLLFDSEGTNNDSAKSLLRCFLRFISEEKNNERLLFSVPIDVDLSVREISVPVLKQRRYGTSFVISEPRTKSNERKKKIDGGS